MWSSFKKKHKVQRRPLHEKGPQFPFRVQRTNAELRLPSIPGQPGKVVAARVVLNDVNRQGVGLYAQEPISVGSEISLTIEKPIRFYAKCRVLGCQSTGSHIISPTTYGYRISLEFLFENTAESEGVLEYTQTLRQDYLDRNANPGNMLEDETEAEEELPQSEEEAA